MSKNKTGFPPAYRDVLDYGMIVYPCAVTADATSGITFPLPFRMQIIDVIGRSSATVASATARVSDGTNNITPVIDIDTLDTNIAASSIDTTYATVESVEVTTVGAAARAIIYLVGYAV